MEGLGIKHMGERIKSVCAKLKDVENPKIVDWLLFFVLMIFCYINYNHNDILATSTHGKDLVECILKGDFFSFYDYTQSTAVYSIIVYIIFAVWSIPVFIVYAIKGIPVWGVLSYFDIPFPILMWYKLLPTLFYFGIAVVAYKIILEITNKKQLAKWAFYLFVSSPIAMFSQFVFGQYDAIGLFFVMLALYFFIKKKYYWFSALTSIAITYKLFAFFFFVPLILLVEKRIPHLIKHGVIAMTGYIITSVMFINSLGYQSTKEFSEDIVPRLFNIGINTTMGTISLFTVAMMTICVVAYNKTIENDDEYYRYSVYIPFFVYATMFMFVLWHPQWVIYVIPFMTLVYFMNEKTNSVLILHSAMSIGYIAITVLCFPDNVDTNMLSNGMLEKIFSRSQYNTIGNIFSMDGTLGNNFFYSLFAGALAILIVMYAPVKRNAKQKEFNAIKESGIGSRGLIWLRTATLLVFVVPTLLSYFN